MDVKEDPDERAGQKTFFFASTLPHREWPEEEIRRIRVFRPFGPCRGASGGLQSMEPVE